MPSLQTFWASPFGSLRTLETTLRLGPLAKLLLAFLGQVDKVQTFISTSFLPLRPTRVALDHEHVARGVGAVEVVIARGIAGVAMGDDII